MADRDRDERGRPRYGGPRDRYGRPRPRGARDELRGRDAGRRKRSWAETFASAVEHFDGRRFFEAHEEFEELWRSADVCDADREFWKGLTQVAVGFCHAQRGNGEGARAVLARAVGRLERYPALHRGVDVRALLAAVRSVRAALAAGSDARDVEFPSFPRQTPD